MTTLYDPPLPPEENICSGCSEIISECTCDDCPDCGEKECICED